jgi:hypothetical protein
MVIVAAIAVASDRPPFPQPVTYHIQDMSLLRALGVTGWLLNHCDCVSFSPPILLPMIKVTAVRAWTGHIYRILRTAEDPQSTNEHIQTYL